MVEIPIVLIEGDNKVLPNVNTPPALSDENTSLISPSLHNMPSDFDMHTSDSDDSDAYERSDSDSLPTKFRRISDIYRSVDFTCFAFEPTYFKDVV